jgi:hypothetical protein
MVTSPNALKRTATSSNPREGTVTSPNAQETMTSSNTLAGPVASSRKSTRREGDVIKNPLEGTVTSSNLRGRTMTSLFDLELFFGLGKLSRCSDIFFTLCQLGLRTENLNNDLLYPYEKLRKPTEDLK